MVARQTSTPVKVPFDCCVDQSRPVAPLQLDVQVEAVGYGRDNRTVQRIAVHERVLVRVEIAQPAPPRLGQVEPLDNRPQAIRRDREPEDRRIVDPVHSHTPPRRQRCSPGTTGSRRSRHQTSPKLVRSLIDTYERVPPGHGSPLAPARRAVLPWLPVLIRTANAGVSHRSGGQAREDHSGGQ